MTIGELKAILDVFQDEGEIRIVCLYDTALSVRLQDANIMTATLTPYAELALSLDI